MIIDTWWYYLIVSVVGYLMCGLAALFIGAWGEHILTNNQGSWDAQDANLVFWLWPIGLLVGIVFVPCWTLSKLPIVFLRVIAPSQCKIEGRTQVKIEAEQLR